MSGRCIVAPPSGGDGGGRWPSRSGMYADGTGEFLPEHLNDELGDNELAELAQVASDLREHAVRLAGVVVANLPPDQNHEKVRDQLKGLGIETAALLPHDDSFEKVTVAEIADTVGADLIYGCARVPYTTAS